MAEIPEALVVVLRKFRSLAPPFHCHIARSRLLNTVCKVGERVVVYEVTATDPEGMVLVTDRTQLQFED
ncbi:MAG: hypothetical protein ACD_39C01970G0002 [uncultured bacterium]|nr:MAG: hypothetical protein ACD_39C01970G0002 [uncultured bacterium]